MSTKELSDDLSAPGGANGAAVPDPDESPLYRRRDIYDRATTEGLADQVTQTLHLLGEDPEREGLEKTPERVAKSWQFLTHGYAKDPEAILEAAIFEENYSEMILVKDVEVYSLCVPSKQFVNVPGGAKRASDVDVGDQFWTLNEGRVVPTTVQEVTSRKVRKLVKVQTEEGTVEVTPDHPFATPEGWVEAQNLEGRQVEWTHPKKLCRERYRPEVGADFGYALGAPCSDGTASDGTVSDGTVDDRPFAEDYAESLSEAFGAEPAVESVSRPSGYTGEDTPGYRVFRVVSSYLADLFRKYVSGDAHHLRQHFPRVALQALPVFKGGLDDGYVDGDGYRNKYSNGRTVVSSNAGFLQDMARMVGARFTPKAPPRSSKLYIADGWLRRHGFRKESHRTDLDESKWVKVERVIPHRATGKKPFTVYSFKCDPHPTFLIEGHLSHNCEHHMIPFFGRAHVAYIPDGRIVGLSKIPRVVDVFARRLQVQERLTIQIRDCLDKVLQPQGVGVVIEAQHLCMMMRGAEKQNSVTTTSAMSGQLMDTTTRAEFMRLINATE